MLFLPIHVPRTALPSMHSRSRRKLRSMFDRTKNMGDMRRTERYESFEVWYLKNSFFPNIIISTLSTVSDYHAINMQQRIFSYIMNRPILVFLSLLSPSILWVQLYFRDKILNLKNQKRNDKPRWIFEYSNQLSEYGKLRTRVLFLSHRIDVTGMLGLEARPRSRATIINYLFI